MKEIYRIKNGNITSGEFSIPFYFGLVFDNNGVYHFDFYISEDINLDNENGYKHLFQSGYFNLSATTEDNNSLIGEDLSARSVYYSQCKIQMTCVGSITYTQLDRNLDGSIKDPQDPKRQTLFYLELEGLKMEFSDLTQITKERNGEKINDFNDWDRDHSNVMMPYHHSTNGGNFKLTFFKKDDSKNIIVAFPNYKNHNPEIVYYDAYEEFRKDFIYFLSFLNGAEIEVRKEYIGGFYNIGKINSQTVISYSFKLLNNESHSRYVPLNDPFSRGGNILNYSFIHCFNNYIQWNKTLDFNSIVFYLNGAWQSQRLNEKFFILIIAFERIAQKYIESLDEPESFIIPDSDYQEIKKDLEKVAENHASILGTKKNILIGRIGELHKSKSTKNKFFKLLEFAKIEVTPDLKNLIDNVRHKSVHKGEIGDGDEGVKNYLLLDQLLRDIILNIIGYDRGRKSSFPK